MSSDDVAASLAVPAASLTVLQWSPVSVVAASRWAAGSLAQWGVVTARLGFYSLKVFCCIQDQDGLSIDSLRGIESAQARIPNVESDQIRSSACHQDSFTNHKMIKLPSGNRPFNGILTTDRVIEQERQRERERERERKSEREQD